MAREPNQLASRRFAHLADVEVFSRVAETGSMSAAAVALSTTPSVVSRAIARLEIRLGTQLLRRSTRKVALTDAGQAYLESARVAFEVILDAERDLQGEPAGMVSGIVRMSVRTTYGHHRLAGKVAAFMTDHPGITVDLGISNRNVDLISEGYDLAIRLGDLPDSG